MVERVGLEPTSYKIFQYYFNTTIKGMHGVQTYHH